MILSAVTLNVFFAAGNYYYGVSIVTGDQKGAGTPNTDAYITLVGSKGHSGKIQLQNLLSILIGQSLDKGMCSNFVIESSGDLGEVLVVILGIDKRKLSNALADPWYVDDVGVYNYQSRCQEVFPCYHWLNNGDNVSFTAHTSKMLLVNAHPWKNSYKTYNYSIRIAMITTLGNQSHNLALYPILPNGMFFNILCKKKGLPGRFGDVIICGLRCSCHLPTCMFTKPLAM